MTEPDLGHLEGPFDAVVDAILAGTDPVAELARLTEVVVESNDPRLAAGAVGEELAGFFDWVVGDGLKSWAEADREAVAERVVAAGLGLFDRFGGHGLAWAAAIGARVAMFDDQPALAGERARAALAAADDDDDDVRAVAHEVLMVVVDGPVDTLEHADRVLAYTQAAEVDPMVHEIRFFTLVELDRAEAAADAAWLWVESGAEIDEEDRELIAEAHRIAVGEAYQAEQAERVLTLFERFLSHGWLASDLPPDELRIAAARTAIVLNQYARGAAHLDAIVAPDSLGPDLAASFWTYRSRIAHAASDPVGADRAIRRALAALPGVTMPDVREEALNQALALAQTRGDDVWARELTTQLVATLPPEVAAATRTAIAVHQAIRTGRAGVSELEQVLSIPVLLRGREADHAPMVIGSLLYGAVVASAFGRHEQSRGLLGQAVEVEAAHHHLLEPWRVAYITHYVRIVEAMLSVAAGDEAGAISRLQEFDREAAGAGVEVLGLSTRLMLGTLLARTDPGAAIEALVAGLQAWREIAADLPASSERGRVYAQLGAGVQALMSAADQCGPRVLAEAIEFLRGHGRPIAGTPIDGVAPLATLMAFTDPLGGLAEPSRQSDTVRLATVVPTLMPWGRVALGEFGASSPDDPEELWIPR